MIVPEHSTVPPPRGASQGDRLWPYRIGLVCLGNICRSPMAAVVLRSRLDAAGLADAVRVDSYGLGPWHVDEPMDARARWVLREHGYDGNGHRARQLSRRQLDDYDLLLAMDKNNLAELYDLAAGRTDAEERILLLGAYGPEPAEVPDPYYVGGDGFATVLQLVEDAASGLVDALLRARVDQ